MTKKRARRTSPRRAGAGGGSSASSAGGAQCFSAYARCLDRCMAGAFGGDGGVDGDVFEGVDTPDTTTADEDTAAAAGADHSLPGSGPDTSAGFGDCIMECEDQFIGCVTRQITRGSRISAETAGVLARGIALGMRASAMNLRAELGRARRSTRRPSRHR